MSKIVVTLAASGAETSLAAEEYAVEYCKKHALPLNVIHICDTSLARYGEIDQLATGCCKADYIEYINKDAAKNSEKLHERLRQKVALAGVKYNWIQLDGKPDKLIPTATRQLATTTLIIGTGAKQESFFSPAKKMATHLQKKCDCNVIVVPPTT